MIDAVSREEIYFLRSRFQASVEDERAFISGAAKRGDAIMVAERDGELMGWVTLERGRAEYTRHTAEIGLGVVARFRGVGIGTALLRCALEWASARGLERLTLHVRASNTRAIRLYETLGFTQEGRRIRQVKDRRGRYDDDIPMGRLLIGS
jgi:ribosomal protein S18 acetylase RimI-like enzyme